MTDVDRALKYSEDFDSDKVEYNELDALRVLAAEVRRLRASIERVKALPHLNWNGEDYSYLVHVRHGGYFHAGDVLAAPEGE